MACSYGGGIKELVIKRHSWIRLFRTFHAGIAVLVPAVTGLLLGITVAALTANRRRGLNVLTRFLGQFGAWIAGMKVEIKGLPIGGLKGPALVVLNHQSGLDPIIVCHVIKSNVVGIAKRQLKYNPLLGPLFWFAESIFVDRADREQRRIALQGARIAFSRGLIVAVAPEGRRQSAEPLAPFRLGGFRLATDAGVPIVPLVIHDSAKLLPPRSRELRPGTVHVDILPAIDTREWQDKTDEALAAFVHAAMLQALLREPAQ